MLLSADAKQERNTPAAAAEKSKRRHARPQVLDSDEDDNDGEGNRENTLHDEDTASNKLEADPQIRVRMGARNSCKCLNFFVWGCCICFIFVLCYVVFKRTCS